VPAQGRFAPAEIRAPDGSLAQDTPAPKIFRRGLRPPEPRSRRITGWLAGLFVCGMAVVWNIGIFAGLLDAADEGNVWWMVCLIPLSLGGWFLLLVLFVAVGVRTRFPVATS
jgi:hypothetical protein